MRENKTKKNIITTHRQTHKPKLRKTKKNIDANHSIDVITYYDKFHFFLFFCHQVVITQFLKH